mmetsp:Transcript_146377/g.266922  ORF Transcript_146377/g.266922 Transcript_146377/m.266922 type:complete len:346 (-) Transcript_146377:70-1107(-)
MEEESAKRRRKAPHLDVPVIDFSSFMINAGVVVGDAMTLEQREVIEALRATNGSGDGFAYLDNAGITADDLKDWFAASRSLFALPLDVKEEKLSKLSPKTNLGYSRLGQERLNRARGADMKESFNVRSPVHHNNDFTGCPHAFKEAAFSLWEKAMLAADRYGLACALALGLEPDFFTSKMKLKDLVTCRFLHYPPCTHDPHATQGPGSIRIGEHTDFGLFTLLFIEGKGEGLEVKRVTGGEVGGAAGGENSPGWKAVNGIGGSTFLVNTGALFARWTNDTWRATAHRVVVPSAEVAAEHRYSIAVFMDPDAEEVVQVDPRFGDAKYPPCKSLEYLLMKLEEANRK